MPFLFYHFMHHLRSITTLIFFVRRIYKQSDLLFNILRIQKFFFQIRINLWYVLFVKTIVFHCESQNISTLTLKTWRSGSKNHLPSKLIVCDCMSITFFLTVFLSACQLHFDLVFSLTSSSKLDMLSTTWNPNLLHSRNPVGVWMFYVRGNQ